MIDAEEFRNCVKSYVELHDEIATAAKHLSELRKKKDALGELVMGFMKNRAIDECELPESGGKLVRKQSKTTETLKKDHILQELMTLVDESKAKASLETIYGKRQVVAKEVLTRTKR
jgi:hypothetical protein